mgnify:CR=1 FL=1
MITLEKVDGATLEAEAEKAGITLPIEQTKVWSGFQADIDGRTPWGNYLIKRDGELVAVISFIDFETHGYHYLRSMHGPAWVAKPTEAEEREVVDAIVDTVKKADKSIAFLRIDTWFADGTEKVLSTVPYDQTVVIDITGGDDEILADSLECFSSAVERYGAPDVLGAGVCSGRGEIVKSDLPDSPSVICSLPCSALPGTPGASIGCPIHSDRCPDHRPHGFHNPAKI